MSEGKVAEKENSEAVTLRSKSGETAPEESREIVVGGTSGVTSEKEEANEEDEFTKIWPIGTPWEHLGTEEDSDSEPFEVRNSVLLRMNTVPSVYHVRQSRKNQSNLSREAKRLPLPRTEEEMRALLKKFTHEATVYRSYYKHWKETAEQAINEVGGRSVLATFLVQGLDKQGKVKKQPAAKPAVTISKSRVPRRAERAKRRGKISTKPSVKSLDEKSTHPAISENDTAVTAVDEVDEKRDELVEEQEEKGEEEQEKKGEEKEEEEQEEKGEEEQEEKGEEKGEEEQEDHPSNPQPSEEPSELSPVSSRIANGFAARTYVKIPRSAVENTKTMFATESAETSSNSRTRCAFL
ncbi:hypothetical protein WN51_00064 [Melipona quadrifasciata]|uniref:Uncharacterized protein n=1 Tax=Melipona quadrifasciata TaxID=166423 RepID=A0A0N0U2S0_9HYME|nr:hypothetical protein WN51_00064 [Melipona quadrifasciata]